MKIASIRKKLTPNASLNNELCVDKKKYGDVIYVKSMVKILEEIAENEQEVLMKEEEEKRKQVNEEARVETTFNSLGSDDPPTPKSDESNKKKDDDDSAKLPDEDKGSRNQKSLSDDGKGRSTKARKADQDLNNEQGDYMEKPEQFHRFGNAST